MNEPLDPANAHRDHGIAEFGVTAGDDEIARPGQHQSGGNAFAVNFRDHWLCKIAPAPRDLQIDLLLARKPAMSIGLAETTPASDRRKIHAGSVLRPGPQVVPGREVRAAAGEDNDFDLVVLHRAVECGVEVVGHLKVLRVARLGPVHHDARDPRLGPSTLTVSYAVMAAFPQVSSMLTVSANGTQEPTTAKQIGNAAFRQLTSRCASDSLRGSVTGDFDAQILDRAGGAGDPEPDQLRLQRHPDQ